MTTKIITTLIDQPSKLNTTGTVTPIVKITKTANLLVSNSIWTKLGQNVAVRVTNTTESAYTIKKNTQVAKFSVVIPEQAKFIKPVDTAILNKIPETDLILNTYLNELIRTKKLAHSNTFWFPTPENSGKLRFIPQNRHKSSSIKQIERKRKIEPEGWHRVSKTIPWTIWLDRFTAYRSWKTNSWRHSVWVEWHFCQT